MFYQHSINIKSTGKSLLDITNDVQACVAKAKVNTGMCNVFIQHTSASLIISENYDEAVLFDLKKFMADLVPEARNYQHSMEGKDDMPAHIRSVLTQTSVSIPINDGKLLMGTWQAIYLWEHRNRAYSRKIIVSMYS